MRNIVELKSNGGRGRRMNSPVEATHWIIVNGDRVGYMTKTHHGYTIHFFNGLVRGRRVFDGGRTVPESRKIIIGILEKRR